MPAAKKNEMMPDQSLSVEPRKVVESKVAFQSTGLWASAVHPLDAAVQAIALSIAHKDS
jgi:hypothetical protein